MPNPKRPRDPYQRAKLILEGESDKAKAPVEIGLGRAGPGVVSQFGSRRRARRMMNQTMMLRPSKPVR